MVLFLCLLGSITALCSTPALIRHFHSPSPARPPRSWSYYAVWFITVLLIWLVAPVSWSFLLDLLLVQTLWQDRELGFAVWEWAALSWATIEALWSIYISLLSHSIQPPLSARETLDPSLERMFKNLIRNGLSPEVWSSGEEVREGEETVEELLEGEDSKEGEVVDWLDEGDPRAVAFREKMRTWFFHAPWSELKRDNILDWIAWSSFTAPDFKLLNTPEQKAGLEHAYDLVQRRTGTRFAEGRNPQVKVMRLTLDKVWVYHRPLVAYLFVEAVNALCELDYWRKGVKRIQHEGISYLIRPPLSTTSPENEKPPLIYYHGLGFGHLQNHNFTLGLMRHFPDRKIVVVVQESISMSVFSKHHLRPKSRKQVVDSFRTLVRELLGQDDNAAADSKVGEKKGVTVLSHSNGSTSHAWILKDAPDLVGRSLFLDPVVFCLWEGDVCYNFIYRQPRTGMELLTSYWIASELGIANTISRYFDWSHNTLFISDVKDARDEKKFGVLLGGKDAILNGPRVNDYLVEHNVKGVMYDPQAEHGAVLFGKAKMALVVDWVRRGEREGEEYAD